MSVHTSLLVLGVHEHMGRTQARSYEPVADDVSAGKNQLSHYNFDTQTGSSSAYIKDTLDRLRKSAAQLPSMEIIGDSAGTTGAAGAAGAEGTGAEHHAGQDSPLKRFFDKFVANTNKTGDARGVAPKPETPAPTGPSLGDRPMPKADAPKADAPTADAPKADAPKADAPKADAPRTDSPKADAPKAEVAPKPSETTAEKQPEKQPEKFKIQRTDGKVTEIQYADGTVRKFGYTADQVTSVDTKLPDGTLKPWRQDGSGAYKVSVDAEGRYKVDDVRGGGSTTRWPDGTLRKEQKDGSYTEEGPNHTAVRGKDGSEKKFRFETDEKGTKVPTSEEVTRNGKTERWDRVRGEDGKLTDEWKNGEGEAEVRKNASVSANGELSYEKSDGSKYTRKADGTEVFTSDGGKRIEKRDGKVIEAQYADGRVRKFEYDGDQVVSATTTDKAGKATTWKREPKDNRYDVKVDEQANYSVTDNKTGKTSTRSLDDVITVTKKGLDQSLQTKDGVVISQSRGDHSLSFGRDEKGEINSISEKSTNTKWTKQGDDTWTASPIDESKPHDGDNGGQRAGKVTMTKDGDIIFNGTDKIPPVRQGKDGDAKPMMDGQALVKQMEEMTEVTDRSKETMREAVKTFEARKDITPGEKAQVYEHLSELLKGKPGGPLDAKDRGSLASQSMWLAANPSESDQGAYNTCNVTTIRNCFLNESPSEFARVMSEVGTTGKFKTADGTTIDMPKDSMVRTDADKADYTVGSRLWASKIWDLAATNIYWQRQEKDLRGVAATRGSITYEQATPTNRQDNGERLYRNDNGTKQEMVSSDGRNLVRTPNLFPSSMMDIMEQIQSSPLLDKPAGQKIMVHKAYAESESLNSFNDVDKLHQSLQEGTFPKIVMVHTSRAPFHSDSGYGAAGGSGGPGGGWHVVLATGYDAKTGNVAIDNSWGRTKDHLAQGSQIHVRTLYNATLGQWQPGQ